MIAAGLAAWLAAGFVSGENRLWYLELELRGACEAVRLDCGPDGETRLTGPFTAGEERTLRVPVPVRSPLGAEGLLALPLPQVAIEPTGAAAEARVRGWSAEQPAERLRREAGDLLARSRPPLHDALARAGPPELLLVLAGGGFLLALRRRLAACAALALVLGLVAFALARSRAPAARGERVLEWEAGDALALAVSAARDRLALPRDALEVAPEGARLELSVSASGTSGTVRAPHARLAGLEGVPAPALAAERNDAVALLEVWTRSSSGAWHVRGPWPTGVALSPSVPGAHEDPPGWLASALPPGRGVLLARSSAGEWLRCLGFEAE